MPYEDRVGAPRRGGRACSSRNSSGEILDTLSNLPVPFDLIVTNASGTHVDIRCPAARRVRVLDVENRGRDIWPLLQVVNAGLLDPYEIVLKVHKALGVAAGA